MGKYDKPRAEGKARVDDLPVQEIVPKWSSASATQIVVTTKVMSVV